MRKNLIKKCSVALAALLGAVALVSCGGENTVQKNNAGKNAHVVTEAGTYPVLKEEYQGLTLSMMSQSHSALSSNWAANEFFKRMEKLTGVKLNFDKVYDVATYGEKFPLTFVDAKTMPDFFFKAQIPRDRELKFGSQGFLIPLEDLIDEYAPNLKKVMEETPMVEKVITAADGHIYALPTVHQSGEAYVADGVFWINKKWCDNLGINPDEITTIEKLREVLMRFKQEDANGNGRTDDERPMYLAGAYELTYLYAAFGMNLLTWNVYVENDTVKMGAQEERFKTMLKYLNGMYEDGLINNDYITTIKQTVWAEGRSNDNIGVFFDYSADAVAGDRAQDYVTLSALTSSAYTGEAFLAGRYGVDPGAFAISSNCEYPEVAMRWIDTLYDVEYSRWDTIGEEGVEWKWDDEEHTSWSYLMPTSEINSSRAIQMGGGLPGIELNYDGFMEKSSDPITRHSQVELAKVRSKIKPGYPPVSLDEITMRAISSTATSISQYLGTLMGNVVMGVVDIDAQWETVQRTLKSMGATKYVQTLQKGYDAFMKN